MTRVPRWLLMLICAIVILFGVATLHYTFGPDEHHIQWAEQHNLPSPSKELFVLGAVITIAGSVGIGCLLGRARGQTDAPAPGGSDTR